MDKKIEIMGKQNNTDSASRVNWAAIRETLQTMQDLLDGEEATGEVREAILQRRALMVAQSNVRPTAREKTIGVVPLVVGEEAYGVAVDVVQNIAMIGDLTPIPCVPTFYRGIVNLRGKMVSVLDLRAFFDLPPLPWQENMMIVVVSGAGLEIGILAGQVMGIRNLRHDEVVSGQSMGYEVHEGIGGVTQDGLVLLDIETLFRDPRLRIYEDVG